jgi:hypothetical protein
MDTTTAASTKKCKFCQSEIDTNAKKCPKCQADLRSWFSRHPIITAIALIIATPMILGSIISGATGDSGASSTIQTDNALEIVNIDTKVTEKNSVWWRFSWVLTIKNSSDRDRTISPVLKWVDKDKFVLDQDTQYSLVVPAGQEATFNGYQLIDITTAQSVEGIEVEID